MESLIKRGPTRLWWIPMLTGLIAIAIGVWCLCSPDTSLPVLAYAFAIGIIFAGGMNSGFALANSKTNHEWGWSLALGLFEIIIGAWLFMLPENTLIVTFIYTIGIYVVFVTVTAICGTFTLHSSSSDWTGWLIAFLLITLLFAMIYLAGPVGGGIAVWLYIGISLIAFGFYRMMFALKLRKINNTLKV